MIAALILGSYALFLAFAGPGLLARWPADRLPRLTIVALQALSCSFLGAAITCGLTLGVTMIDSLAHIDPTIDACADQLPINDESPVGPLLGWFGLTAALVIVTRIGFCLVSTFRSTRRTRREHIEILRVCARVEESLGVLVLDHDEPACYCLPGRPGTIVVTSGALRLLTEAQLAAVLAHERAHLKGRHHFTVAFAHAVHRSAPGIRILALVEQQTRRLVEFVADDEAIRRNGSAALAAALAVLGTGGAPGVALGIGGDARSTALCRVSRLASRREAGRRSLAVTVLGAVLIIVVPVVLGLLSAATLLHGCPKDHDDESPTGTRPVVRVIATGDY